MVSPLLVALVIAILVPTSRNGNCNGLPPDTNAPVLLSTLFLGFQYPSMRPLTLSLTSVGSNWFNWSRRLTLLNALSPSLAITSSNPPVDLY
jgi:hypothetical protein